jgi:hypothetical protein
MSEALRSSEFVALALLDVEEPKGPISSGRREIRLTLGELQQSNRVVQQARADLRLFLDESHGVTREIWALSPSNAASLRAKQAFASELSTVATRRRIAAPDPNEASVALLIRVGSIVALLGADLEYESAEDRGWNAILGSAGRPRDVASLYKVAHHGAVNGDHPRLWEELLEPDVLAVLTPYGAGRRPRPDDADVARICGYTSNAYIAGPLRVRLERASSPVEKIRRRAVESVVVSDRPLGHVQCRRTLDAGRWDIALSGDAGRLCPLGSAARAGD